MYYRLNDGYALRGWKGLPYAIESCMLQNMNSGIRMLHFKVNGKPYFLNEEQYDVVRRFDGKTLIDETELTVYQKSLLYKALEKGFAKVSENTLPELTQFQKYIYYPAMYVKQAVWSITGKCNYRCRHCILSAPDGIHPQLPLEDCKRIVKQLAECGIRKVVLTGGEPLIRKDFLKIAEMLTDQDIEINTIMTNGKFVTPELLDGLERLGQFPSFQISFDGLGHHDSMRGISGAEEAAVSAIRLLVSRNYATAVSMCIDRQSASSIRDTINYLAELGVEGLGIAMPQKFGAWESNGKDCALSLEEGMEIFLDYIPHYFEDGMPIMINLGGAFECNKHGSKYSIPFVRNFDSDEELQSHLICSMARYNVYISAEGQLMPCLGYSAAANAKEFPNILEIPLKEALSESLAHDIMMCRMKEYFARNEKCRSCEKRLQCAGGCRVNAMTGGKDNLSIDEDACKLHLGGYEQRVRETADEAIKRLGISENITGVIPRAVPGEG